MMSGLTAAVNLDLTSRGESAGLNERKLGDILTSLSFTNRSRRNAGYTLWLDRSDRARIHATASDYRIEGTRMETFENCEIYAKPSAPSPASVPAEDPIQKEVRSEDSKSERREVLEGQLRSGTRSRIPA
jgi:hypothetical protein